MQTREDNLAALKQSLRRLAPTATTPEPDIHGDGLVTGHGDLDQALESGGLPRGKLCELAGAPSSGKTTFALNLVRQVQGGPVKALAAFIDGRGQFFPPAAASAGIDLERLLWVRPDRKLASVARATEILIRSRAFALIVIDVPHAARLGRAVTQRLRTSASQTNTSLIVLCDRAGDVEGAHTRLKITPLRGRRDALESRLTSILVHKGSATGAPITAPLTLARQRGESPCAAPIAPVTQRTAPGAEPPGFRHREPPPSSTPSSTYMCNALSS